MEGVTFLEDFENKKENCFLCNCNHPSIDMVDYMNARICTTCLEQQNRALEEYNRRQKLKNPKHKYEKDILFVPISLKKARRMEKEECV